MISHDEMLDNVAAYALGVLSPREAAEVAEHVRTCERCREELRLVQPAVTAVAFSAEACPDPTSGAAVASPMLKARVMKHVRADSARASAARVWPAYAAAAACLALAIGAGTLDLSLSARLDRERAQVAQQAETIADFMAPDARHWPFAHGEVLVHAARLYIAMHDMPMPPPGKVYQAWTVAKGTKTPAPSRTFMPAQTGMTVVRLPEASSGIAAVAISVEPSGGSLSPTTKPIAVVAL